MKKYSYCIIHDTYPTDDEPCWACIRQFSNNKLSLMNNLAADIQKNRKPIENPAEVNDG